MISVGTHQQFDTVRAKTFGQGCRGKVQISYDQMGYPMPSRRLWRSWDSQHKVDE
jgi:hypothetical protein